MKTKKDINRDFYERNKHVFTEKARMRRAEAKNLKVFAELMKEFADDTQLAESTYLQSVVNETDVNPYQLAQIYKKMRCEMKLTEHQRLHIANNIPVKKLLKQRLNEQLSVSELL